MIFLLEGPDLGGKTSIADALMTSYGADGYDVKRFKSGPLPKKSDAITEYLVPLQHYVDDDKTVWILDRWHLGEVVYGPILRGGSRLTMPQLRYIELALMTLGTIPVHVTAQDQILKLRYESRGDELVSWDQLRRASAMFSRHVHDLPWYLTLRTEALTVEQNAFSLRQFAEEHAHKLRSTRQQVSGPLGTDYLGGPHPRMLLLGEKQAAGAATTARPFVRWPFAPWNGTSGHWLFQAMIAAQVNIMRIGLLNACEQPLDRLYAIWELLGMPPVVTLGLNAKKWTDEAKVPIARHMPHPQFARRFHHDKYLEYGLQLKEVMK